MNDLKPSRRAFQNLPYFSSLLVLPLLAAFMAVLWLDIERRLEVQGEREQRLQIEAVARQAVNRLKSGIDGQVSMTRSLVNTLETDPSRFDAVFPFVSRVLAEREPALINIALSKGFIVTANYPDAPNRSVLGRDIRELSARGNDLEAALLSGQPVIDGPQPLVQGGIGVIVRMPILTTDESGGQHIWGVVSSVADARAFLTPDGVLEDFDGIEFGLRKAPGSVTVLGNAAAFDGNPVLLQVDLPQTSWDLAALPTGGWKTETDLNPLTPIIYVLICSGVLVLVHTALLQLRRRREAERMLFEAMEAVPDGFAIYDKEDRFLFANSAYKRYYAASAGLIEPGRSFEDIIRGGVARGQYPQAAGREEEWIAERLRAHSGDSIDIEQQLDDGRWLRVLERKTPSGTTVGFRFDITELVGAREAAKQGERAKADFISMLSHELRTPLTITLGYAKILANLRMFRSVSGLLAELDKDEPSREVLRDGIEQLLDQTSGQALKMQKSGEHLLVLINDLLDYSKIEAGQLELSKADVSLDGLVLSIVEDMQDSALAKGLALEHDCQPIIGHIDQIRIKQVLINLIANAIKFTDTGVIGIRTEMDGDRIRIEVTDTGCGIGSKDLEKVFAAFKQVDFSDKRKAGGTGLGLAISRNIVELHEGEISVTSTLGEGSTFTILLPDGRVSDEAEEPIQGVA